MTQPETPDVGPSEDDLANLLAACDEGIAAGEYPPATASGNSPSRPDSGRLERDVECLRLLRQLWPRQSGAAGHYVASNEGSGVTAAAPLQFGRFSIRRELGRGGYGIVYLAHDERLARDVALKVPRSDAQMLPELRARFEKEAHAAAMLDHPYIVPVFESGEEDGVCYLVSAFCPGMSLAEWISRQTSAIPAELSAKITCRIAEAVQHAHARGVLHRDLKPSNVMLQNRHAVDPIGAKDDFDGSSATSQSGPATGLDGETDELEFVPRVTDFGLAKVPNHSTDLTATGAALGTPCYMSPEQATGKNEGEEAADVYGLGAILYELLTHRPPFQADTPLETLRQVVHEEPMPPAKLRSRLPRDLETICLKCLRKDPRQRYASAEALADDLRRFLRHEPIVARPISTFERSLLWCHRRPLVAGLLAALVFVSVGGFTAVCWQWYRAQQNAIAAEQALARTEQEHRQFQAQFERAEANFNKARELVDRLTAVGKNLTHQPHMQTSGHAILQEVLTFHQQLLDQKSHDPRVRRDTAARFVEIGKIQLDLGQWELADENIAHGIRLFETLAIEQPDNAGLTFQLAWAFGNHAHALRRQEKIEQSGEEYDRAIAILEKLKTGSPARREYWDYLANFLMNSCIVQRAQQRYVEAVDRARRAVALDEQLVAAAPDDRRFQRELAFSCEQLAMSLSAQGDQKAALVEFRRALQLRKRLFDQTPESASRRYELAESYVQLTQFGPEYLRANEVDAARAKAIELLSGLVEDFPDIVDYRRHLADSYRGLARSLADQERTSEAEQAERAAAAIDPGTSRTDQ